MRRSSFRPKPSGVVHNPEWGKVRKARHYVPHALVAAGLIYLGAIGVESFESSTYLTPNHEGSMPKGPSAGDLKKRPTNPFRVKWDKADIPHDPAYKGDNKCLWTPDHQAPARPMTIDHYGSQKVSSFTMPGVKLDVRCFEDASAPDGRPVNGDPTTKRLYTYAQPSILPEQNTRFDAGSTQRKYYSKRVYAGCLVKGEVETDTNGVQTDAWLHILAVQEDKNSPAEPLQNARTPGSQLFVPYAATGYATGLAPCPANLGLEYKEPPKPPSTWEQIKHDIGSILPG